MSFFAPVSSGACPCPPKGDLLSVVMNNQPGRSIHADRPRRSVIAGATFLPVLLCAVFLGACRSTPGPESPHRVDFQRVRDTVSSKLAQQRGFVDGTQRWEQVKSNNYQAHGDIVQDRNRLEYERQRDRAAETAMKSGPLSLESCLVFAVEFNDVIQAHRAKIRAVGGEALVTRSRFLPDLTYTFRSDSTDTDTEDVTATNVSSTVSDHSVRLTQTLLEFGKDAAADVALRSAERDALFAYEAAVGSVLATVRKKFFAVLLRSEQLAEQKTSLQEFRARYEQVRELEKARRVLEVDVLTARLNMLNEEARINSLQKEILRQKINLANSMGFPVSMTTFTIQGNVEAFGLPLEDIVQIALQRSPSIARDRAEVAEQARLLRQLRWEFAPSITAEAGWKDALSAAGLEIGTDSGTYNVSTFAELHSDEIEDRFADAFPLLGEDEEGSFAQISLELPIFQGLERRGRRRQAKALLEEKQHLLRSGIDVVELTVRKDYQTMLERRQAVEILRETVAISRKRLRIQERLKELGNISDNELETFRNGYFRDLDNFFTRQIDLIEAQENLRQASRYFEPVPSEAE